METRESNYGDVVCCDFCNEGEETLGGVLVGSYAICGNCCEQYDYDKPDYEYSDEVSEIWSKEKTFKQNVLEYRKKVYGTSDLIVRISSFG
jgi:hypothetical protein